jgi:hypothetical protein
MNADDKPLPAPLVSGAVDDQRGPPAASAEDRTPSVPAIPDRQETRVSPSNPSPRAPRTTRAASPRRKRRAPFVLAVGVGMASART